MTDRELLELIAAQVGSLTNTVDGFKGELGSLTNTVDGLKGELGSLTSKVDNIEAELSEVRSEVKDFREETNKRFDKIDTRFDGLENKLDDLEAINAGRHIIINQDILDLKQSVCRAETNTADNWKDIAKLKALKKA